MQIKRSQLLLLLALATALVTSAALAIGVVKFLRAPSATLGSPKVIISWTEIGLGNTDTVHYVANATVGASYQCLNRGGNCPNAANKADVLQDVSVGATFSVDRNGRITGTMTVPAPPATLVCPGNQVPTIYSAVFTNIRLTDTTNNLSSLTNPSSLSYNTTECP